MSAASIVHAASGGKSRQRVIIDHERIASDWYVEPAWSVELLLDAIPFRGAIHDPACGSGNIPKAAWYHKAQIVTGSDLVYRGYGKGAKDFLADHARRENLIFNPPYKIAEKFILHALEVATGKVAAIVNLKFLASQGRRARLFKQHPPLTVLILSRRPSMPPGGTDIAAKGGTADYCWIVWDCNDFGIKHTPSIGWLA